MGAKLSHDPKTVEHLLHDAEEMRAILIQFADWARARSGREDVLKRMRNGLDAVGMRGEAADPLVKAATLALNDVIVHTIESAKFVKNFAAVIKLYEETVRESKALRGRPEGHSLHVN